MNERAKEIRSGMTQVQEKIFELIKKNPLHMHWYIEWFKVWAIRLDQLERATLSEENCNRILETVNATEKSLTWRQPTIAILQDVMLSLSTWTTELAKFFNTDYTDLITCMKSMDESPERIDDLIQYLLAFKKIEKVRRFDLETESKVMDIEIAIDFMDYDVDSMQLTPKRVHHDKGEKLKCQRTVGSPDLCGMRTNIGTFVNRIKDAIENSINYSVSLNVAMTSIFEESIREYYAKDITIVRLNNMISEYLRTKRRINNDLPRFNDWLKISNRLEAFLTTVFDCLNSIEAIKKSITKNGVTTRPIQGVMNIRATSDDIYENIRFDCDAMIGAFKSIIRKLWKVYGERAGEVWTSFENIKFSAEQLKNIENAFVDLAKTSYEKDVHATDDSLHMISSEVRSFLQTLADIQKNKNSELNKNDFDILDKIHSKIIAEYIKNKKIFEDFIQYQVKLINSFLTAVTGKSAGN